MVIELRVMQFWSEIILVISNQARAARSFEFEITRMVSDQTGQFRIPGRTGASGVKPTKVRLMRGRNELTRAVAMANHYCFAFNCTNKKQKTFKKYLELADVRFFFPFLQDNANKYCSVGMSERERRMR